MMYRLLGPGGSQEYWSDPEWEKLGEEARYSLDQDLRLRDYRRMNEIALEHLPWIPVVQPRRLYGISNAIDFRPYGNGTMNLRRENLKPRSTGRAAKGSCRLDSMCSVGLSSDGARAMARIRLRMLIDASTAVHRILVTAAPDCGGWEGLDCDRDLAADTG